GRAGRRVGQPVGDVWGAPRIYPSQLVGGPSMQMSCQSWTGGIVKRSARGLTMLGAALVVAGLLVAGCSGSGEKPVRRTTTAAPPASAANADNSGHNGHAVSAVPPPPA